MNESVVENGIYQLVMSRRAELIALGATVEQAQNHVADLLEDLAHSLRTLPQESTTQ